MCLGRVFVTADIFCSERENHDEPAITTGGIGVNDTQEIPDSK
jgi:hypothetical protein